jgi:hypothetical protein
MEFLTITKNQNTFAKRQREMEKKRKAEDKRARRKERKEIENVSPIESANDDSSDPETVD